jgi:hypothetical protein
MFIETYDILLNIVVCDSLATINLPGMRSLRVLIHGAGLSSLAAALFLQGTVFLNILQKGYL